jgi:hypothetical protein
VRIRQHLIDAAYGEHPTMSDERLSDYERRITTGTMGAFGRYLMERTFDEAMWSTDLVLNGEPASADNQALRERLRDLTDDSGRPLASSRATP